MTNELCFHYNNEELHNLVELKQTPSENNQKSNDSNGKPKALYE